MAVSKFDTLGTLELHLWTKNINITKRCMAQFLTVMHDELMIEDSDDTIRAKVDEFLKEIVQLLTAFSGPKRKSAEQSDLVSQTDLDRFYSGIHTPWFLTTWICNAVEGWPQKIGVDPQKEPDKKIDVDKVQRICWKYYLNEKKAVVTKEDWLSPECTYRLFLLYNKLLLRDDTTDLEVGQVCVCVCVCVRVCVCVYMCACLPLCGHFAHSYRLDCAMQPS